MKAIWTTRRGRPEVLEVREGSIPEPGPGEVRIAVRAAGLNFAEVAARQGLYPDAPPLPAVLGYELAGTIDALGEGVETHARGARVAALMRFGAHASHVCVPAAQAFPIPEAMPFEEGAALPVNYVTAYHMLFRIRRLQPGETVLVHMAAGGVGTAALQLCRSVPDVRVIGTCSKGKH
ncbi:MAG: alcohol dehydrogenase catalytic domain-containing protein, partial [Myxococcales bacterium]|nr:alcohol dehydrogenase catalytic domain-containing protein [Myxococcales bacterium]